MINRDHITFIDDNQPLQISDFNTKDDSAEKDKIEEESNPLDNYRIPSSETAYVADIQYDLRDDEGLAIAPGENKMPLPIIRDENCELLAHPYLFPTGKFGCTYQRGISLSPSKYFNQRLLNYSQKFASASNSIFFAQSVMQHLKLNSSINIAMQKIKSNNLTAGILSQNYTYTIKSLIAKDEAFNFMNTLKETPAYWKRFQLEVLAMIKQLGLPTFFITLSCADLRWHELIEIIYKLNEGDILTDDDIHSMN